MLATVRAGYAGHQSGLWTALPATVNSYNAAALTVEAQPTIQAAVRQPNGNLLLTTMPLCLDCPVMFPGGGGFFISFPLAKGDEGLLVFSSRCIDAWWQNGGVQPQAEYRMHDLSDGFFFPTGGMSQPNVPGSVSTNSCRISTKDATTYVEITKTGQIVNIVAPGGANITGSLKVSGDITWGPNSTSATTHTHQDVTTGTGNSGPPNPGS